MCIIYKICLLCQFFEFDFNFERRKQKLKIYNHTYIHIIIWRMLKFSKQYKNANSQEQEKSELEPLKIVEKNTRMVVEIFFLIYVALIYYL